MTLNVLGYAAQAAKSDLAPYRFTRRDPRPDDVVIDILYCGVCHTDVHYVHNDWGRANYPLVPGHEIVGRVAGVGADVTRFKAGDHVAVGCMVDSCRECAPCEHGLEQYCENGATFTYNNFDRHDHTPTYGGYSDRIVVSDRFVLRVRTGWISRAPRPCSVQASPPGRRCATGRWAEAAASPSSAWAGWATWR